MSFSQSVHHRRDTLLTLSPFAPVSSTCYPHVSRSEFPATTNCSIYENGGAPATPPTQPLSDMKLAPLQYATCDITASVTFRKFIACQPLACVVYGVSAGCFLAVPLRFSD